MLGWFTASCGDNSLAGIRKWMDIQLVIRIVGTVIFIGIHTALMTRSDRLHDAVVADLKTEAKRDADAYLKGATATAYTAGWAAAEENRFKEGR